MKKTLLYVFLCLVVLLTGCERIKRKLSGGSSPKTPPKDPFYTATSTDVRDLFRFPLKYPYEICMIDDLDDGYLAISEFVKAPESESGIMLGGIIDLHLHEDYAFFRREDWTYGYLQYSTGEIRRFETEEELKRACLLGPDDFKPLEYYYKLFEKGTLIYPPPDPSKPKKIRFHVISHFHGLAVKMIPEAAYSNGERGPAIIRVVSGDTGGDIEIETGKLIFGNLSQEAQDWIGKWLPLHRDELMEIWETRKLKEIPPLE